MRHTILWTLVLLSGCRMADKDFVSNFNWFTLKYPTHWTQFEEDDGTYLFMDNDDWKGNLRITAIRLASGDENSKREYLQKHLSDKLKENTGARKVKLGDLDAVYYTEDTEQDGEMFEMHYWATGAKTTLLICSFTMDKNKVDEKEIREEFEFATKTLASIKVLD